MACICVLRVTIIPLSTILIFVFRIVATVWYVFACVLASSVIEHGSDSRSGQTKDYGIGICCFFAKHEAIRRKNKDWLSRNLDNMPEWGDLSIREL